MGGNDLSGGRRRRRAQVSGKVSNREVSLMPNSRDDWNCRCPNRACDRFFIERPKVFNRATAAADNQDVDRRIAAPIAEGPRVMLVQKSNRALNFMRRAFALNTRGRQEEMHGARASGNYVDDVANCGAAG